MTVIENDSECIVLGLVCDCRPRGILSSDDDEEMVSVDRATEVPPRYLQGATVSLVAADPPIRRTLGHTVVTVATERRGDFVKRFCVHERESNLRRPIFEPGSTNLGSMCQRHGDRSLPAGTVPP